MNDGLREANNAATVGQASLHPNSTPTGIGSPDALRRSAYL
jgi:hypothetical protein